MPTSVLSLRATPEPCVNDLRRPWFSWLLLLSVALLSACSNYEEKRMRELFHEKGFGSRAQGDATIENYVAGGDAVAFVLPAMTFQDPAAAELARLGAAQRVAIDGKILIPYVGPVQVLGLTEAQLSTLVKGMLQGYFQFEIDVQARIIGDSKNIYCFGETGRKGIVEMARLGADLTLLRAVSSVGFTPLANLARVQVIRPDAEHPLRFEVDVYEMIMTGNTHRNMRIRENDIIYIPPTFLGMLARLLQRLLQPVNVAVQTMLGFAQIRASYDFATGKSDSLFFRF